MGRIRPTVAFSLVLSFLLLLPASSGQAPPTVYEADGMSPQNMDYDADAKLFKAHPGWLNDHLIHYYKFRMYTPSTYPDTISMGGANVIPVAPLYLPTTDGGLSGVPDGQLPILRFHHDAGDAYSDFVQIHWVPVGPGYAANDYDSYDDIQDAGIADLDPAIASDIYVNLPVVPTDSRLEAPGGGVAPIEPLMVWYDGEAVQTFAFETTSQALADTWNPETRTGDAAAAGSGFEMVVTDFVNNGQVSFIPIWHLNQFFTGVEPGVNSGGPADMGQRNIIDKDRLDVGYSPLWQVWWVKQVPQGYGINEASHAAQITSDNGFEVAVTPMFVNCPNIGPHGGGAVNPDKATTFGTASDDADGDSVTLEGSLVMQAGKTVTARIDGEDVASATTGMMGAYSLDLPTTGLAPGEHTVEVVYDDADAGPHTNGQVWNTFDVTVDDDAGAPGAGALLAGLAVLGAAAMVARRRRHHG